MIVASSLAGRAQLPQTAQQLPDAPAAQDRPEAFAAASDVKADQPLTLKKLPARFVTDEVHVFTAPARVHTDDWKWLLPLAGATAASLSTDSYTMRKVVSHDPSFNDAANTTSGALRDTAIAVPIAMYALGGRLGDGHMRDTGLLGGEAMLDAYVFSEVVKYAALRERPYQDNANGRFFAGSAVGDPSFISGHSIVAWSSAAVLAQEYHRPWQQATIYALASGTALTRVLAQDHFPTDALLGSAAGWLIGHYVYRAHHRIRLVRRELQPHPQ